MRNYRFGALTRNACWRAVALAALLSVFLCACDGAGRVGDEGADRPNFLFIISDDQSWMHTSKAGYDLVRTPNFDRIASEGLYFTHAFTSAPSCTPSRSAILAGQDFWRLESAGLLWGEYSSAMISYQDILRRAGYAVGSTGKGWGPGYIANRSIKPTGDEFNAIKRPPSEVLGQWDLPANFASFLKKKPKGKPFSFWVGSFEPHRPYDDTVPNRFTSENVDTYIPPFLPPTDLVQQQLSSYLDEIELFDRDVGALIQVLKDSGHFDNTIIVVTSDNGMEFSRAKPTLYAYGVRVPLAIYWSRVARPRTIDGFVSLTDIAPTFLAAAGVDIPEAMTGHSLLPLLEGGVDGPIDWQGDAAFVGFERHAGNARAGNLTYPSRAIYTQDYTYIRNYFPERWPVGDPPEFNEALPWLIKDESETFIEPYFSLLTARRPGEELYDLREDPFQMDNVAADPDYAQTLKDLRERLTDYLVRTRDPVELSGEDVFSRYKYHGPE